MCLASYESMYYIIGLFALASRAAMIRRRNNGTSRLRTPLPLVSSTRRTDCGVKKNEHWWTTTRFAIFCFIMLCCSVVYYIMSSHHEATLSIVDARKLRSLGSSGNQRYGRVLAHTERDSVMKYANLAEVQTSNHHYDVIIVGCGPAGLTAALFASRMGMSVLVVGSPSSGSLSGTDTIDNFPSFFFDSTNGGGGGADWIDITLQQAAYYGANFAPPTYMATNIIKATDQQKNVLIEVHLSAGGTAMSSSTLLEFKVLGKSLIIASGSLPRKLNLPYEISLWGRHLHNCALCDGDAYVRDGLAKTVAVIGGGDAAVEAIFLLHKLGVSRIHWIHRREEYNANPLDVQSIRQLSNVDIWAPYVVVEWIVKEKEGAVRDTTAAMQMEGIRIAVAHNGLADSQTTSSLVVPCDGAFLMIGSTPNSEWLVASGLNIDPVTKLIRLTPSFTDATIDDKPIPTLSTSTSIQGVFAAGEVADNTYRQALTASAEGAKAAMDVHRYLRFIGQEMSPSKQSLPVKDRRNDAKTNQSEKDNGNDANVDCDLATLDCINIIVASHPVVVFSKSYCPHCRRALEALHSFSTRTGYIEPLVIDLASREGMKTQELLATITGRRTVPNVFVGGISIGGGDETASLLRLGTLEDLLFKAGAIQ